MSQGNRGGPIIHVAADGERKLVGVVSWGLCPRDTRTPYGMCSGMGARFDHVDGFNVFLIKS